MTFRISPAILAISLHIIAIPSLAAVATVTEEFDLQGFIDQSVRGGCKSIVIPPGCYRVTPRNQSHLVLRNLVDTSIVADGVEMICTETTRAVSIENCRNVVVRGLTIDYDPLPFTQGRIVKLSEDKKVHEIELFDGYPTAQSAIPFKYEIFRPDTRTLRCPDHDVRRLDAIDPKHIRIATNDGSAKDVEQVGDLVVVGATFTPHGSVPHAVMCSNSVNVRLENIKLYASSSFGFFENGCSGCIYRNCEIDRRPRSTDIVKRADPRLRSLNADAFHSKCATKGPTYIACVAKYMGDDAININGDYQMVTECRGSELRVLAKGQMNIAIGDAVELFAYDGQRLPNAKVVAMEQTGKINTGEKAFLVQQSLHERFRTGWNANAWKVTLERAVELPRGSLIASAERMGNGFLVQGCDFGFNRSRGIIIKASNGKVIDNKLTENWMPAILVSAECWWLESGNANNIEIRGNVISGCRERAILVCAHSGSGLITGKPAPAGAHSQIVIADNSIAGCPLPNIEVTSLQGGKIENNILWLSHATKLQYSSKVDAITTVNCVGVTQSNNAIK